MKKIMNLSIIVFLLFAGTLKAQTVSGIITDTNKEPVPYVSVMIGPAYSVMSNEEGAFIITLPQNPDDSKVTFSSIGYENLEVPLTDFKGGSYTLKTKVNELADVFITNKKYTPEEILTLVVENAPKNYAAQPNKATFFLRSSSDTKIMDTKFELVKSSFEKKSTLREINKDIDNINNKFKGQKSTDFSEYYGYLYQQDGLAKLVPEKAIRLVNLEKDISGDQLNNKVIEIIKRHLDPNATYKVKTGLITVDDSLSIDSPQKKEGPKTASLRSKIVALGGALNRFYKNDDLDFITDFKRYTYTLEGFSTFNDETIYVIDFQPKKSGAKYFGKIYVNAMDFAVVKLDYTLAEGKTEHNINVKFLLGIKMRQDRTNVSATYIKNEEGHYAINFVKKQEGTYFYIDRPLKFTKNKVDKKEEENMFKIDFMVEQDNYSTDELFIIGREKTDADTFANIKEKANYEVTNYSKYSPEIWKNYNVLAPVDAIKNYK